MNAIGSLFKGAGMVTWVVSGIWGFFLCIGIISDAAGFWGIVGALFLGPITFVAAPLYAGFQHGNWFPLILNYGGSLVAMTLIFIGSLISKD